MRVLITKSGTEAREEAGILSRRGFTVVHAPLLHIHPTRNPLPDELSSVRATVITSANGIRSLVARISRDARSAPLLPRLRALPLYTVGSGSAEVARTECGFTRVHSANGNSGHLLAYIRCRMKPADGPILCVAASGTLGVPGVLEAEGYRVVTDIAYESVHVPCFPAPVTAMLCGRSIDFLTLYSPRAAQAYVRIAGTLFPRGPHDAQPFYICLSSAVAQVLKTHPETIPADRLRVARHPSRDALFSLLPDAGSTPPTACETPFCYHAAGRHADLFTGKDYPS